MNGSLVCVLLLVTAVVVSGLLVVFSQHQSRTLFVEIQELNRERDALDSEWGMLRLEQGAWATHGRVERLAREELDMVTPGGDDLVILRPARPDDD